MAKITQGICDDGAAILRDGVMLTIEEIIEGLRQREYFKNIIIEHNKGCNDMCDPARCGYPPYQSRRCPQCSKNYLIYDDENQEIK